MEESKSKYEIITPLTLNKRHFFARFKSTDAKEGDYNTIHLSQIPNISNGDNWKIDLDFDKWRTKKELASLLRCAADIVERVET